jgi:toxin YoeB
MKIIFSQKSWEDYLSWNSGNKLILRKINDLICEIQQTPYEGSGKPEPLMFDLAGFWSRVADKDHRLVYQVIEGEILIYSCRYYYDK